MTASRMRKKSLFRDQRGTASLEVAMMLPLMGICWIGLFFWLQQLDTTLQSANEARQKAWASSNAGCVHETIDYDCNTETSGDGAGTGFLDGLKDVPIVGWLFGSVFGYSTTVRVSQDVPVPDLFGGGTGSAAYSYYVMCNERPMTVTDLLKSTICEQFSGMGLDIGFAVDCPPARHADAPAQCME